MNMTNLRRLSAALVVVGSVAAWSQKVEPYRLMVKKQDGEIMAVSHPKGTVVAYYGDRRARVQRIWMAGRVLGPKGELVRVTDPGMVTLLVDEKDVAQLPLGPNNEPALTVARTCFADEPPAVVFVVDCSESMLDQDQRITPALLEQLTAVFAGQPGQYAVVVYGIGFATKAASGFVDSIDEVVRTLKSTPFQNESPGAGGLPNALRYAAELLRLEEGNPRRAMLLLTNGDSLKGCEAEANQALKDIRGFRDLDRELVAYAWPTRGSVGGIKAELAQWVKTSDRAPDGAVPMREFVSAAAMIGDLAPDFLAQARIADPLVLPMDGRLHKAEMKVQVPNSQPAVVPAQTFYTQSGDIRVLLICMVGGVVLLTFIALGIVVLILKSRKSATELVETVAQG